METKKDIVRCAIYCRKSVEKGLDMEFNTLDAQREAAEAYIASQKANGWVCLPEHYDDGGFSGGNLNRPGLKKLLRDCEAGKVDVIVIYKIDRLSRSLCDFADLSRFFEKWNVAFVSVTQEINTQTSAGRMMLNILMTFAQFEREMISSRIKDKMSATRKKGKWVGGNVPFGYYTHDKRLVVDKDKAPIVQRIFQRYLEIQKHYYNENHVELPGLPDPWNGVSPMTDERFVALGGTIEDDGQPTPEEKFFAALNAYLNDLEAEAQRLALDISIDEFKEAAGSMMSSELIAWAKQKGVPDSMIDVVRPQILTFIADASRLGMTWADIFPEVSE